MPAERARTALLDRARVASVGVLLAHAAERFDPGAGGRRRRAEVAVRAHRRRRRLLAGARDRVGARGRAAGGRGGDARCTIRATTDDYLQGSSTASCPVPDAFTAQKLALDGDLNQAATLATLRADVGRAASAAVSRRRAPTRPGPDAEGAATAERDHALGGGVPRPQTPPIIDPVPRFCPAPSKSSRWSEESCQKRPRPALANVVPAGTPASCGISGRPGGRSSGVSQRIGTGISVRFRGFGTRGFRPRDAAAASGPIRAPRCGSLQVMRRTRRQVAPDVVDHRPALCADEAGDADPLLQPSPRSRVLERQHAREVHVVPVADAEQAPDDVLAVHLERHAQPRLLAGHLEQHVEQGRSR